MISVRDLRGDNGMLGPQPEREELLAHSDDRGKPGVGGLMLRLTRLVRLRAPDSPGQPTLETGVTSVEDAASSGLAIDLFARHSKRSISV